MVLIPSFPPVLFRDSFRKISKEVAKARRKTFWEGRGGGGGGGAYSQQYSILKG